MQLPSIKIDKDTRKGAIILCFFFLIITVPILISSYNKRADDLKMYDYFSCPARHIELILEPYTVITNETYTTSCARLRLDPKIVTFGKPAEILVGLYPFIIFTGLILSVFTYQAAMEGY